MDENARIVESKKKQQVVHKKSGTNRERNAEKKGGSLRIFERFRDTIQKFLARGDNIRRTQGNTKNREVRQGRQESPMGGRRTGHESDPTKSIHISQRWGRFGAFE